jgi:hypothetical protein
MRPLLTALIVISILVMAQSVLAITSAPSTLDLGLQVEFEDLASGPVPTTAPPAEAAASIGGAPEPMATFLLLTGISGLAAAGNRPSRMRQESPSTLI